MAALDRNDAQRLGHIAVDDFDDCRSRLGHPQPERIRHPLANRCLRCRVIDCKGTSQYGLAIEVTEHDIGVADRRLRATFAVSRRARIGPGAPWSDFQRAAEIDPSNAATAGADLGEVDDRYADRMT